MFKDYPIRSHVHQNLAERVSQILFCLVHHQAQQKLCVFLLCNMRLAPELCTFKACLNAIMNAQAWSFKNMHAWWKWYMCSHGEICIHDGWVACLAELCAKYYNDGRFSLNDWMFGNFSFVMQELRQQQECLLVSRQPVFALVLLSTFNAFPVSTWIAWRYLRFLCCIMRHALENGLSRPCLIVPMNT